MKLCTSLGCSRAAVARGLCSIHYHRRLRRGAFKQLRSMRKVQPGEVHLCGDCARKAKPLRLGRCPACYQRHRYLTEPAFRERRKATWRAHREKRFLEQVRKRAGIAA